MTPVTVVRSIHAPALSEEDQALDTQLHTAATAADNIAKGLVVTPRDTPARTFGRQLAAKQLEPLRRDAYTRLLEAAAPATAALDALETRWAAGELNLQWYERQKLQLTAQRKTDVTKVRLDLAREISGIVERVERAAAQAKDVPPLTDAEYNTLRTVRDLAALDTTETISALADVVERAGPGLAAEVLRTCRVLEKDPTKGFAGRLGTIVERARE